MSKKRPRPGRPEVADITDPQKNTLEEIRNFIKARKYPPTMNELGDLLGVTAASAHQQIIQLERKGYVKREPRKARSLTVLREVKRIVQSVLSVPVLGHIKAGPAMLAEENWLGEVMVDKSIVGKGTCFALNVTGDSMTNAGIKDGDIVIVRQQPVAESGDIVVAIIGDEATVKRLFIRGDQIELRPENKRYKPIRFGPEAEFSILGKVLAVRSNNEE